MARHFILVVFLGLALASRMRRDDVSKGRSGKKGRKGRKGRSGSSGLPSPFGDITQTVNGCTCKNSKFSSRGNYAACEWCKVESGCAGAKKKPLRGAWDYVKYDKIDDFEALTHSQKRDALWSKVEETQGKTQDTDGTATVLKNMVLRSMRTPFENPRDTLSPGRVKVIHQQGVVCKFDFDVESSSKYTGMLKPGKQSGLMRLGSATPAPGLFPGIAIKFLRSSHISANVFALRTTGPDGEGGFFDTELTNHGAPPEALVKLRKFQQASGCISMIGLSDMCTYDQNGNKSSSVDFPWQLFLEGHEQAKNFSAKGSEVMNALAKIPAGVTLYKVYAKQSPSAPKKLLGKITTTSSCLRTMFGDKQMHFHHQRMEEDFALKPDWAKQADQPHCEVSDFSTDQYKCL